MGSSVSPVVPPASLYMRGALLAASVFASVLSAGPLHADTLDNAEAKRRGIPVEAVQLEREQKKNKTLREMLDQAEATINDQQNQILDLRRKLAAAVAAQAAPRRNRDRKGEVLPLPKMIE